MAENYYKLVSSGNTEFLVKNYEQNLAQKLFFLANIKSCSCDQMNR